MKVTCLIEDLGSGGAQRQMCALAGLLKESGWQVKIIHYHSEEFFVSLLESKGIPQEYIDGTVKWKRVVRVRRALRRGDHDVVLAFLRTPSLLAELSTIPWRTWGLVVSERTGWREGNQDAERWRSRLHCLADFVTVNSNRNRRILSRHARCLKDRVITIYNTVDLDWWVPGENRDEASSIKFLVVARVAEQKNVLGVLEAFGNACRSVSGTNMRLEWYGDTYSKTRGTARDKNALYRKAQERVIAMGLKEKVAFYPPTEDILSKYREASALLLGSFYEGMPNVVCEAMACGRPILMSRVGDAEELVKEGRNGFLFDPNSVGDITETLVRFARLSVEERVSMGKYSRILAEKLFGKERFLQRYSEVLTAAANKRRKVNRG